MYHGSHIFGLTNFPDFSSILSPFSSIFSVFYLMNLTNIKIYLTSIFQLKSQRNNKNKKWLKFPHFSSISGKFPWLFQYLGQISLTFPVFWVKFPDFSSLFKIPRLFPDWKKFSHFSSPCVLNLYCNIFFIDKLSFSSFFVEVKVYPRVVWCTFEFYHNTAIAFIGNSKHILWGHKGPNKITPAGLPSKPF